MYSHNFRINTSAHPELYIKKLRIEIVCVEL